MSAEEAVLTRLAETIAARATSDADTSYVASLLAKGPKKCAEKFGEEAIEAIIAAATGDDRALVSESADVLFHWLVMLKAAGVSPRAVFEELTRREGISGHSEKANRAG